MPKRKKKKRRTPADPNAAAYICPTCGEQIIIPLDPSQGADQTYTEDCPVCCHPNIIHVESDPDWTAPRIWAESE